MSQPRPINRLFPNPRLSFVAALLLSGLALGELAAQQAPKAQQSEDAQQTEDAQPGESSSQATEPPPAEQFDPQVRGVIEKIAALHQDVDTLQVNLEIAMAMTAGEMEQKQQTAYAISYKRPRRYALRVKSGQWSPTVVSDGEQVFTYYPTMKRYTREEVSGDDPLSLASAGGMGAGGMAGAAFQLAIPSEQLTEQLMIGVEQTEYVGKTELDGVTCHRLKFTQDQIEWELWVQAEERPLPRRMEIDMSKAFAESAPDNEAFKDATMRITATFDDWKINTAIPDEQFEFTPPEDAQQVDSIMEALMEETADDGPHPLVGEEAPRFAAEDLKGAQVELQQYRGQVVVLDFWATWCPPCVEGLPKVAEVASELEDEGVVFYAVNVGEDAKTVKKFLEDEELDVPVLMDPEGAVAGEYQANAIPQTVLIGKQGTVQAVHVGLSGDVEETLRQQLAGLLEGKDLASEQLKKSAETAPEPDTAKQGNLEQVWSVESALAGVAVDDASGMVYAVGRRGRCVKFDAQGNEQSEVQLDDAPSVLRAANLAGDETAELISFTGWGRTVKAHDAQGNLLWNYAHGQGVDDVWPYDLDGDSLAEVIIGYNGSTGLHVLDNRGELLWKNTQLGNVWHVAAGDVLGSGEPEVVSTSARGRVHLFTADGDKLDELSTSCYANVVRIAQQAPPAEPQIIVGGSASAGEVLIAMDATGEEHWQVTLAAAGGHIDSARTASGAPWIAVGMRGGNVHVVDVAKGKIIASHTGQGRSPNVAWLGGDSETAPLLVVATGSQLNAFRVLEPADETPPAEDES